MRIPRGEIAKGQLVLEKENSEFKPVKLRLKIDLVSYPARAEGLAYMIMPGVRCSNALVNNTIDSNHSHLQYPSNPQLLKSNCPVIINSQLEL